MSSDPTEKPADAPEDDTEQFPPGVLRRILALRKGHEDIEAIDAEYKTERIALEQKFRERRAPVYEQRRKVVNGLVEVEVEAGQPEDAPAPASEPEEGADLKGIPGFWLQCLGNHPVTSDFIQEDDAPLLSAIEDIKVEYDEEYTTFTITFEFAENEYITNRVLTKKYTLTDILDERAPELVEIESSDIVWKEGKNLTVTEIKKKQKAKSGKNKGQVRTVTRQVPKASFFHYFSDPKPEGEEDEEEGGGDDEKDEDARIHLNEEEDYEIGHVIRTALLPDAILWYTGEARDDEDFDFDEEEDGDEDDEEDGEGEEEEDEDDAPAARKGGKKNKGGAAPKGFAAPSSSSGDANGEKPECKQN